MTKRGKIRVFTVLCGAFLVLALGWANSQAMLRESGQQLEYAYRRALNDLTDYVSGMESALEKAPYAGTAAMRQTVSAKLLEQSGGAKGSLAALPFPQEKSDRVSRFLSQVGDYALSLTRKAVAGESLTEDEADTLRMLASYAGKLSQALQNAQARLETEQISLRRTESLLSNVDEIDALPVLDDEFDQMAEEFAQFPALLYDGPFSDHILQREPMFLQGKEKVSSQQAQEIAADILGCSPEELSSQGPGGSQLKVWSFSKEGEEGSCLVNITQLGGEVAYFKKDSRPSQGKLGYEEALEKAGETLTAMGISHFRESYYVINDNLCTINFAALELPEDVICYPDLIKVTIELQEGGAVEYDAAGYLMNHRQRELSTPSLTEEEAAKSLSPLLTVREASLALIPTPGLSEALCYEFRCVTETGAEALCYINVETGLEEQLYLLRRDDHGVLAV